MNIIGLNEEETPIRRASAKQTDPRKEKAKLPRLSRKLLLEGIEVILETQFGAAGVALMPKVRTLKTIADLRGLLRCVVQSQTLGPVAVHLSLKELLSTRVGDR